MMTLDNNVQLLIDYIGACERIHKTPLPFAYVVHLRRALILYCLTLPFALIESYGWSTVIDTLLIAYILFGIEEIGVEIEDPFGKDDNDLPLEQICATIERNLLSVIRPGTEFISKAFAFLLLPLALI
jgi:putative membrane protein